jgi:hypothetical protein
MSGQWEGGKGSRQRAVDTQKYNDNYDAIFGKKKVENKNETSEETSKAEDKIPQSTIRPG